MAPHCCPTARSALDESSRPTLQRAGSCLSSIVAPGLGPRSTRRVHDTTGDYLGLLEHPAPNVGPGDVVVLAGWSNGAHHCAHMA